MGTSYSVTLATPLGARPRVGLRTDIERALAAVVDAMSTYDRDSELSRFNRSRSIEWQRASPGLFSVLEAAVRAGNATRGAFDVTIGPLVDLWGFGPRGRSGALPGAADIERARARVGIRQLRLDAHSQAIAKRSPSMRIDLSSIAKGYGVDQVAALLQARGINDYLVDIGGEIRAAGLNADRRAWRIAIEAPAHARRAMAATIGASGVGIATSGTYRDFFERAGRRYPHIIDPRSAQPVAHPPTSVTVVADTAMLADARATALAVMGADAGYRFAKAERIAALFITGTTDAGENLGVRSTPAFAPYRDG